MFVVRVVFVAMVSVFLGHSQRVVGAPVLEKTMHDKLLKPDKNIPDEVNLREKTPFPGEVKESKTKGAGKEASDDSTFANFNPNNTIAYSSSNIITNDAQHDMIFIPSSEIPSDTEDVESLSEFTSEDNKVLPNTIDTSIASNELPSVIASQSDYKDYYSYSADWRELSWLAEFSEQSVADGRFKNELLGNDDTDPNIFNHELSPDAEDLDGEDTGNTDEIGGYEETIDEVKTRKKRSLESYDEEDVEEDNYSDNENESSLASSFADASMFSSGASSEILSSSSVSANILTRQFNDIDPKRADIEKALARYPRPGNKESWKKTPTHNGDKRQKRTIDLFKYYAVNFPTLEGMKKRGNGEFEAPFDVDNIANDLVPAASKSKRSLDAPMLDNPAWDTLEESFDVSSYDLGPFEFEENSSDNVGNDIYMPDIIDDSKEFDHFLSYPVPVPQEYQSRGHRFDIPDYNEGKYLTYRSAHLKPLSNNMADIENSPNVPDPEDLLRVYQIVKSLNAPELVNNRNTRMYLPGPHAGYQAYGNEIHRGMFGSKRGYPKQANINSLPIGLEHIYRPKQNSIHDSHLNALNGYSNTEESLMSNTATDGDVIDDDKDATKRLEELIKEIDELTIIEKLLRLVEITNQKIERERR